ncbi:S-acyltransferase [Acrasis kona]|uniref:Palmitoyltransferase n=1 Tax=Acrasis kona TaxID=1008807 RepID=A0AAW2ZIP4_9EUKA
MVYRYKLSEIMCCGRRRKYRRHHDPDLPVQRADVYPGNHIPIAKGRLLLGPDVATYVIAFILICVPSILFFVFTCRYFVQYIGWAVAVPITLIGFLLFMTDMYCLIRVGTIDPGILPKNTECYKEFFDITEDVEPGYHNQEALEAPPNKEIEIDGIVLPLKWCSTCKIYRTPRASHCSRCDCCIERFDHHCPWTGTCIGQRNHRYFFFFVTITTLMCLYGVFACGLQIGITINAFMIQDASLYFGGAFFDVLISCPVSFVLFFYALIMILSVGSLSAYHFYLITQNQTTYDKIQDKFSHKRNPFNHGAKANIIEVLFSPLPASRLCLDQKIVLNEMIQEEAIAERITLEHEDAEQE